MNAIVTPLANRGLNSQVLDSNRFQVGIDWIQGTIPVNTDDDVLAFGDFLQSACHDVLVWSPGTRYKHGRVWENVAHGAEGLLLAWTISSSSTAHGSLLFSLSARVVERIGDVKRQCQFIKVLLNEYLAKFTRIDIAIDDFRKELRLETIHRELELGNFSGFRDWDVHNSSDKGWTIYLGSRNSERMTRIYNKLVQSKGEIDAIRWEAEIRKHKAVELGRQIACLDFSLPCGWIGSQLARFALGGVSFIIRSDKNLDRCEIVDWFKSFLSSFLSPIKLRVQRIKPTIEKTVKWLERSVSTSLAMIAKVKGKLFVKDLIELGESRLGAKHQALISTSKFKFESISSL